MSQWQTVRQEEYSTCSAIREATLAREIRRETSASGRLRWRLSLSDVAAAGPLATPSGYQRILSPLAGDVILNIDGTDGAPLRPYEILRLSGDSRVSYHLPGGPIQTLSLIYDPRHYGARLLWERIDDDTPPLRCHASTILLFCHGGDITLLPAGDAQTHTLSAGDSALLTTATPQTHSVTVRGRGLLAVFELTAFR